jgi:hypothetical protein
MLMRQGKMRLTVLTTKEQRHERLGRTDSLAAPLRVMGHDHGSARQPRRHWRRGQEPEGEGMVKEACRREKMEK